MSVQQLLEEHLDDEYRQIDTTTDPIRIYLAGPIHDRDNDGRDWRGWIEQAVDETGGGVDIEFIDPNDTALPKNNTPRELVEADFETIDRCDGVLSHYRGERMFGTPMEIALTRIHTNIPVVISWDVSMPISPWIETFCTHVTETVPQALAQLLSELGLSPDQRWYETVRSEYALAHAAQFEDDDEEVGTVSEPLSEKRATTGPSGDELAGDLLADVSELVRQDRDSHGDAVTNQAHISRGWNWYLNAKYDTDLSLNGADVARLMQILKLSRHTLGSETIEHDRDIAGYAGIAGAVEALHGSATIDDARGGDR